MKKNLLILAGLLSAVGAFAQGSIQFNNRITGTATSHVVAPIYGVDPTDPTGIKTGNPANAGTAPIPVGTQVYNGAPLLGTGFTASIWARVAGTQNAFVQAATTPFRATTSATLAGFWTIPGLAVVLPNVPSDPAVRPEIIVRAWDNNGGLIDTWAKAIDPANTTHGWGESLPFIGADQLGGAIVLSPTMAGMQGFQLHVVPEPSVIALGALGAGCLFMKTKTNG